MLRVHGSRVALAAAAVVGCAAVAGCGAGSSEPTSDSSAIAGAVFLACEGRETGGTIDDVGNPADLPTSPDEAVRAFLASATFKAQHLGEVSVGTTAKKSDAVTVYEIVDGTGATVALLDVRAEQGHFGVSTWDACVA